MINLIKNEFTKIFRKKIIYIFLGIGIVFSLAGIYFDKEFNNPGYYYDYYGENSAKYEIEYYKENLERIGKINEKNALEYVNTMAYLEFFQYFYVEKDIESWKFQYMFEVNAESYFFDYYNSVYSSYITGVQDSEEETEQKRLELEEIKNKVVNITFDGYIHEQIATLEKRLSMIDAKKQPYEVEKINTEIKYLNYRKENSIAYDNSRANIELLQMIDDSLYYYNRLAEGYGSDNPKETVENYEEYSYYEYKGIEKKVHETMYIFDNHIEFYEETPNQSVRNYVGLYTVLIVLFIALIAAGILSSEFENGTIKTLLITPYSRAKVLTSKLITILLMIPILYVLGLLVHVILSFIILGFSGLDIPVLIYNFETGLVAEQNVFIYSLISFIKLSPIFICIGIFALAISIVKPSALIAGMLSFLLYAGSMIVVPIATSLNVTSLKYMIFMSWDLNLFNEYTKAPLGLTPIIALIVFFIYTLITLVISYIVFNKKNIKNV